MPKTLARMWNEGIGSAVMSCQDVQTRNSPSKDQSTNGVSECRGSKRRRCLCHDLEGGREQGKVGSWTSSQGYLVREGKKMGTIMSETKQVIKIFFCILRVPVCVEK